MKDGPNLAPIAALAGDPARANMLAALMSGKALTATELAGEAGVTLPTASSHLAKLTAGGLVAMRKQGRHRYYSLLDEQVAEFLEQLMHLAARTGHLRTRTGPREPALRRARVCYDHLAGELGVALFDGLISSGLLAGDENKLELTRRGKRFVAEFGIDIAALAYARRPMCRTCLDWSMRRKHLAGSLGAAFLQRIYDLKWAKRDGQSRAVLFSVMGERQFRVAFAVAKSNRRSFDN